VQQAAAWRATLPHAHTAHAQAPRDAALICIPFSMSLLGAHTLCAEVHVAYDTVRMCVVCVMCGCVMCVPLPGLTRRTRRRLLLSLLRPWTTS
jgi:hypothetical protein